MHVAPQISSGGTRGGTRGSTRGGARVGTWNASVLGFNAQKLQVGRGWDEMEIYEGTDSIYKHSAVLMRATVQITLNILPLSMLYLRHVWTSFTFHWTNKLIQPMIYDWYSF